MSYYAFDADGYVGDVASIGGWNAFRKWGAERPGPIADLCEDGYTDEPAALLEALSQARAPNENADSVRRNLIELLGRAQDELIITEWD